LEKIRQAKINNTEIPYHLVEVMACPGGCVGGGGQPYMVTDELRVNGQKLYIPTIKLKKYVFLTRTHILKGCTKNTLGNRSGRNQNAYYIRLTYRSRCTGNNAVNKGE